MRRKPILTPEQARAVQAPLDVDISEVNGKAADRRFLDSLRPVIEQAAREGEARGILKATVEAQKRAAAEKRQREQERIAEISAYTDKQKDKAQRKNAAPDNRPTPERLAKLKASEPGETAIDGPKDASSSKPHQAQNVVEFYRDRWSDEELQGARYLVQKWNDAEKGVPTVTPAYTGVPGSAFGPRDGGVRRGRKTETFVDLHWEVLKVEGVIFDKFGAKGLNVVRWFCWETVKVARSKNGELEYRQPSDGPSMGDQMEAAGKALAPFVKDAGRLWGLTFGHLQAIFRFAYAEWVMERGGRPRESSPEQVRMRIAQKRKRWQEKGLVRPDQDGPAFKNGEKG